MMKGGISLKTVIVMVILVLVGVLGVVGMNTVKTLMSGASADAEPKNVLAKANEDGKSATVNWTSDKAAMGVVEYGTTPASLLLRSVETEAVADHKVSLSPLKPGVNYYFRIRVGEEIYDNNGIPFSFKTKEAPVAEVAPTAAVEPTPTVAELAPAAPNADDCDADKDGRTTSIERLNCKKAEVKAEDKCDADKNGRVSSVERLNCK